MIYPEIDSLIWQNKYKISPEFVRCEGCGGMFKTSTPVRIKGYAGLETQIHECGREFATAVFVPIDPTEKQYWKNLYATAPA